MPKTRSYDDYGIRLSEGIQPKKGSQNAQMNYEMYNTCLGSTEKRNTNLVTDGKWRYAGDGYAFSFKLPKDESYSFIYDPIVFNKPWMCTTVSPKPGESSGGKTFAIEVKSMEITMSYEVLKTYTSTINTISAFGSYQHSKNTIDLSTAFQFTIGNGLGGVFIMTTNISKKFDGMSGTHAQITNAKW